MYSQGIEEIKALYPHTGKAFVLGITGPPGVGKSTISDLLKALKERKIDPYSVAERLLKKLTCKL